MRIPISPSIFVLTGALLAGCATAPAPVVDRSMGGEAASPQTSGSNVSRQPRLSEHANGSMSAQGYVVARGDTLYSIAFRHGMDYRALAGRNGIAPPYTIHPGQVLRLDEGAASASGNAPRESVASNTPPHENNAPVFGQVENNPRAAQTETATNTQPATPAPAANGGVTSLPQMNLEQGRTPATNPPPQQITGNQPPQQQPLANPTETPLSASESEPLPPAAAGRTRTVDGVTWQWPADGPVISGDSAGVDVAGSAGDPVRAAADGTVVYSGNGLIGYGELIIIKHSDNYLSAYGHNRKRLVQEGQRVHAGQQIAEMGSTGAAREELHFEIRKAGKPVDPTGYLPER